MSGLLVIEKLTNMKHVIWFKGGVEFNSDEKSHIW